MFLIIVYQPDGMLQRLCQKYLTVCVLWDILRGFEVDSNTFNGYNEEFTYAHITICDPTGRKGTLRRI